MAQNISIMGANYTAVPAVTLPKTGGGTAQFDDTTGANATAADIMSGKTAFVNGQLITGTAQGGGASNFVTGTFTTGSSDGAANVNIPYTGTGYPISVVVVVEGGAYNPAISGWYNSVQRYAVGQWTMTKSDFSSAPTYATNGTENYGVVCSIYKNSASNPTTYTRSSSMGQLVYSSRAATGNTLNVCKLMIGNVLSYYVNTSSYGLLPNTTYRYYVVYSS